MKPAISNIPSLTPLRGIAAALVAVFHFQVYYIRFVPRDESMFIDKGYLMVDLFFLMSGFLIMHVYGQSFSNRITRASLRKFIVARFARIYPLHIITLLLMVAVFYLKKFPATGFYDPGAIVSHIFLLHSFPLNKEVTWNIPSWSISAEWWSYMLFPFLCLLLFKKRKITIGLMLLLIIVIYIVVVFFLPRHDLYDHSADLLNDLDVTSDYGFLRSIAGFMSGMLLYLLYCRDEIKKRFSPGYITLLTALLVIYCMHKDVQDLVFVPLFGVLILGATSNTGKLSALLNNKPLAYLGDISYSVYMLHFLLIQAIMMVVYHFGYHAHQKIELSFIKGLGACGGYFVILLLLSAFSYRFIEKPCRKYITAKWSAK